MEFGLTYTPTSLTTMSIAEFKFKHTKLVTIHWIPRNSKFLTNSLPWTSPYLHENHKYAQHFYANQWYPGREIHPQSWSPAQQIIDTLRYISLPRHYICYSQQGTSMRVHVVQERTVDIIVYKPS